MSNNEFGRTVAIDFASQDSLCEWCGEPAMQQLTVIGGKYHNKSGSFCRTCGEAFTLLVNRSAADVASVAEREKTRSKPIAEEKYGSDHLPLSRAYREWAERSDEDIPIPLD